MRSNLSSVLPGDDLDDEELQARRQARVASAYAAVFSGRGTEIDADLVLVDLAMFSRYYDTANLAADPAVLAAATQRRAVFQRIMDAMAKAGMEPDGLLTAVLTAPPIEESEL